MGDHTNVISTSWRPPQLTRPNSSHHLRIAQAVSGPPEPAFLPCQKSGVPQIVNGQKAVGPRPTKFFFVVEPHLWHQLKPLFYLLCFWQKFFQVSSTTPSIGVLLPKPTSFSSAHLKPWWPWLLPMMYLLWNYDPQLHNHQNTHCTKRQPPPRSSITVVIHDWNKGRPKPIQKAELCKWSPLYLPIQRRLNRDNGPLSLRWKNC